MDLGERKNRFSGALLGTAFGDALGAGVEGMAPRAIRRTYGEVRDYLEARGRGRYTDDTQMTLALARSLLRTQGVDGTDCARSYAELFDPERGYGRSAATILELLRRGVIDDRSAGTHLFPGGSFGNGAAMRIAPLGLIRGGLSPRELRPLVEEAVRCTHIHPEAIDGAAVQAAAVHHLAGLPRGEFPQSACFLQALTGHCRQPLMKEKLLQVGEFLNSNIDPDQAVDSLGTGVRTAESVPAALYALLRYGIDPEETIVRAVNWGGDADTIGAMAGALAGALHGACAFPRRWHEGLENGPDGRDALIQVAEDLAEIAEKPNER